MYNCQLCGKTVPAHTPAIRVVLATNAVVYPFRKKVNRHIRGRDEDGPHRNDSGGKGTQIASEVLVCQSCAHANK